MKEDLDRIHNKLDKVSEDIASINQTLIRQESSLGEHMRRSLANEEAVKILKDELKPVTTHVLRVETAGWIVAGLSFIAGLALTIKQLFW